nr:methyltransferase [Trichoderma barbatum polymycovirus 1]
MLSRKRDSRPPVTRRQRPPATGGSSPPWIRRPSETGMVVSVAPSSRSSASSATGGRSSQSSTVTLPLTLFEFGFPRRAPPKLTTTSRFSDDAGTRFMNSEAGRQLRSLETEYGRVLHGYIKRSCRLSGASVLVLGSGSSKKIANLLLRGVSSVTFVDTSQEALDDLSGALSAMGIPAMVEVDYVCADAWDYLVSVGEETFDLVIASKCVGLILASGPHRTTDELLNLVIDVLRPGGDFLTDHHEAFSSEHIVGQRISKHARGVDYDVATIGGRYAADVCYNWDFSHRDAPTVLSFTLPGMPNGIQSWTIFHFRAIHRSGPVMGTPVAARVQKAPRTLSNMVSHPFDQTIDAMIPVNFKGVKRVVTPAELKSYDLSRAKPKFDGVPGILSIVDNVAAFMSPTRSAVTGLHGKINPPLVMTAEMCNPVEGGFILVVTGIISVAETPVDPNDPIALASVSKILDSLNQDGIMVNSPVLVKQIRGNAVILPGQGGRVMTLPVDGINVHVGSLGGVFFKPPQMSTVDAPPDAIAQLLESAYSALRIDHAPKVVPASLPGVSEYALDKISGEWRAVKQRPDKNWGDSAGAVIQTVGAARAGYELSIGDTVELLVKQLTK